MSRDSVIRLPLKRGGGLFSINLQSGPVDPSNEDLDWSVGRVAERLGVPPATLRTWDRRYGIGPSQRTSGGHRRYSEEDIRRVGVMARFIGRGVPAQTAARVASSMDTDRLRIETEVDQPTEVYAHAALVTAISSAALTLNPEALSRLYQLTLRERDLVGGVIRDDDHRGSGGVHEQQNGERGEKADSHVGSGGRAADTRS